MRIISSKLEQWYSKFAQKAEIDISGTGINVFTLEEILNKCDSDLNYLAGIYLDYDNSQGDVLLREEIVNMHNVKSNSVLITNGASEALFLTIFSLMDRQKNIVVENPYYQSLESYAQLAEGHIKKWEISENDNYYPNIDKLTQLIDRNTSGILINHPNNPTGSSINYSMMEKILSIAEEHNFFVISDEVSRELTINKKFQLPPVCEYK